MVEAAEHYPSFAVASVHACGACKSLRVPSRALAHGMLPFDAGVTAMGKALAAWLLVATAMAASATTPRDVVQGAVTRVVSVLQDEFEAAHLDRPRTEMRRAEIRRVARELFAFDEMARRTLTRHWNGRTPEERAEFVQLVTDLLERAYIARIEQFSGERIIYIGETVDGPYATVRSRILTRRPTEIALDYRLLLRDGRWRAYDVLVDGVSFVATFRTEFERIIQQSSYATLVDKLRKRTT
ncbi:MAG TPA: ABC transporter substrate-binding protein [Methylomirabilota bacterium]|jgi:phospholipid transport system substrate-binding protein